MANKQNFKPEEWTKTTAEHDVGWDGCFRLRTKRSLGRSSGGVCQQFRAGCSEIECGSNALIKAVVADFETKEGRPPVQASTAPASCWCCPTF